MPLSDDADLTLFYAPRTRAFRALWFLEELGRPYRIHRIDYQAGEQKRPDFLKLNPSGKLPTVLDGDVAIAETGAILTYLADKYPPGNLAPRPEEPERAAFLRWIFYSGSVMEPAFAEKFFGWDLPADRVGWGNFDTMLKVVTEAVSGSSWLTGDRFTAADLLIGGNLQFGMMTRILPQEGPIAEFVARCSERPALKRAMAIEAEYANAA